LARSRNRNNKIQKIGAVFGLIAGLIIVSFIIVQFVWVTGLTEITPEAIVQWTIDHHFLLFYYPLLIMALIFFGVLLQGIDDRLKAVSPNLAALSNRFGWMTILLIILSLSAEWIHVYLNSTVWNEEIALQFSRLTFNTITFFQVASYPFFAGWLIVTGIGGIVSKRFSKLFSWVAIIAGIVVGLQFFGEQWQAFFSIPLIYYLGYVSPYAFVILIWASFELLVRKTPRTISEEPNMNRSV